MLTHAERRGVLCFSYYVYTQLYTYMPLTRSLALFCYVSACFLFIICWLWCARASKDSFWIERHVSSIKKNSLAQTKRKKAIFVFIQQGRNEENTELAIFGTSFKCYNPFVYAVWFKCCSRNTAAIVVRI